MSFAKFNPCQPCCVSIPCYFKIEAEAILPASSPTATLYLHISGSQGGDVYKGHPTVAPSSDFLGMKWTRTPVEGDPTKVKDRVECLGVRPFNSQAANMFVQIQYDGNVESQPAVSSIKLKVTNVGTQAFWIDHTQSPTCDAIITPWYLLQSGQTYHPDSIVIVNQHSSVSQIVDNIRVSCTTPFNFGRCCPWEQYPDTIYLTVSYPPGLDPFCIEAMNYVGIYAMTHVLTKCLDPNYGVYYLKTYPSVRPDGPDIGPVSVGVACSPLTGSLDDPRTDWTAGVGVNPYGNTVLNFGVRGLDVICDPFYFQTVAPGSNVLPGCSLILTATE